MKKRLGIISLFVILFIAFIVVWNYSYQTGLEEAYIPVETKKRSFNIPSQGGMFKDSEMDLDYANMPVDENHQRSLDTYYDNRAFHGAPPSIPHPVKNDLTVGDNTCLQCHKNGGFVEKFDAYTPITPHPELINCRQCHVSENTTTTFTAFKYSDFDTPQVGVNSAFVGGPPTIPHQIDMHESCLSCHAGPTAPKEIRVTHPERTNCMQCHVLNTQQDDDLQIFIKGITNE